MDDTLKDTVCILLKKAGFAAATISWERLSGGRNNRVYRLDIPNGTVLLKQYFRGDDWDRLATESRFLLFCTRYGIRQVPKFLAEDSANNLALHSWVDGERPKSEEITYRDIAEAVAFFDDLVNASHECELSLMTPARDAALCLEDFFRSPRNRLAQLLEALLVNPDGPLVPEALAFYKERLWPAWMRASETAYSKLAGKDLMRPFQINELCVSPSDIGFHNALRVNGGGLVFLDFEYAGLDSPIKAACDFICQADYPLQSPPSFLFADEMIVKYSEILLPLFFIKFACIVLNEFKECDTKRRWFANGKQASRVEQLRKGHTIIETMQRLYTTGREL